MCLLATGVGGRVVQVVNVMDGAVASGTTILPINSGIPQNTEGDEQMTLAITPTSATNKLKIEVVVHLASSSASAPFLAAALFQDTTADSLAVGYEIQTGVANETVNIAFTHYMTTGTTSATTFKVRVGSRLSGTTTFNGSGAADRYGGVSASSITIWEISV